MMKKVKKSRGPEQSTNKQQRVTDVPPEALLSSPKVSISSASELRSNPDILSGTSEQTSTIEKIQTRQKDIEEENRKTRKILLDTINERSVFKLSVLRNFN